MSKIDIFVKIRLFNEKIIFKKVWGLSRNVTLNLNQYKLSILLRQFYFYKAPNMEKCPKLTGMGLSNTFFDKIDFFSKKHLILSRNANFGEYSC